MSQLNLIVKKRLMETRLATIRRKTLFAFVTIFLVFLTSACAVSNLKEFNRISPGMEKDDVLNIMGSPTSTLRRHGKDRWFYVFYDESIRFEKEVQFFEGKAVYVGDLWQPPPDESAELVDKRNAIGTEEGRRQLQKDYQEYLEHGGKDKSSTTQESGNKKTPSQPSNDVKYLPSFQTVQ